MPSAWNMASKGLREPTLYRFKTHRRVSDLGIHEISYAAR